MSNQEWQSSDQDQLSHLWDEYKYRHGLCWQAVYKVIAAVLFLGGLPYASPALTKGLGWFVVVPPIMGTLFTMFGVFVVNNELKLFAYAKVAHNQLQVRFIQAVMKNDKVKRKAVEDRDPTTRGGHYSIFTCMCC